MTINEGTEEEFERQVAERIEEFEAVWAPPVDLGSVPVAAPVDTGPVFHSRMGSSAAAVWGWIGCGAAGVLLLELIGLLIYAAVIP